MYVYNTTHTHTFKDGKPHAENMAQKKNQRLGKPHYQV